MSGDAAAVSLVWSLSARVSSGHTVVAYDWVNGRNGGEGRGGRDSAVEEEKADVSKRLSLRRQATNDP